MNIGERIYLVVEYDSDGVADIVAGQFLPSLGTLGIHRHAHYRAFQFIKIVTGIGNHVATQRCFASFTSFQGNQLIHSPFLIDSLHRPAKNQVAGQNISGNFACQHRIHGSRIVFVNDTDYRRAGIALRIIQQRKQRILFTEERQSLGFGRLLL